MIDKRTFVNELVQERSPLLGDPQKAEQVVDTVFQILKEKVGQELVEIDGIGEFRTEAGKIVFTPTRSLMDRISESSQYT